MSDCALHLDPPLWSDKGQWTPNPALSWKSFFSQTTKWNALNLIFRIFLNVNFSWTWRLPRVGGAQNIPFLVMDTKSSSLKVQSDWNHFWYGTSEKWYLLRLCAHQDLPSPKGLWPRVLWIKGDEVAGRRCVALPTLVQKNKGSTLSRARPRSLDACHASTDLDFDRRARRETELLCYYVTSQNPRILVAVLYVKWLGSQGSVFEKTPEISVRPYLSYILPKSWTIPGITYMARRTWRGHVSSFSA